MTGDRLGASRMAACFLSSLPSLRRDASRWNNAVCLHSSTQEGFEQIGVADEAPTHDTRITFGKVRGVRSSPVSRYWHFRSFWELQRILDLHSYRKAFTSAGW